MDRQLTAAVLEVFTCQGIQPQPRHESRALPEHCVHTCLGVKLWTYIEYIYMSLQSGTEYSCTQKGAAQNWDNNERTHGVRDASQAAGTYADRLETLANVREAGISVSR